MYDYRIMKGDWSHMRVLHWVLSPQENLVRFNKKTDKSFKTKKGLIKYTEDNDIEILEWIKI